MVVDAEGRRYLSPSDTAVRRSAMMKDDCGDDGDRTRISVLAFVDGGEGPLKLTRPMPAWCWQR